MKNTLGKILITMFSLISIASANTDLASFELKASKANPYVREAVEITFIASQKDTTDVMFFFLEPKNSSDYKIVLLNKSAKKLAYHNKQTKFSYLLFPLKDKKISVDFDFTIKVASDEAVAQVYEGSRDNVKWIETTNTQVNLEPLILNVKSFGKDVDLVGDFTISSSLDKRDIDSYDSANITYTLTGRGYNDFTINPVGIIMGVDIFSDISKHYENATKDGYEIKREFNYALLSKNNIHVKSVPIKCYSPKKEKFYTLNTQEYKINVTPINKATLIDKTEFPEKGVDFSFLKTFFIYLVVFFTGFATAKILPKEFKRKNLKFKDIRDIRSPKELLYLLMHKYSKYPLKAYYEALNDIVYNNASKSKFNKIKKAVLKELEGK